MEQAVLQLTGHPRRIKPFDLAGRTDRRIARDLLLTSDSTPTPKDIERLIEVYLVFLEQNVAKTPYRPIRNIRKAVHALRNAGCMVGLGTGNAKRGAEIKLASAGIADLFDFSLGGYGDDAESRADVLRVAVRRCDPAGGKTIIVIGDTPSDVQAACDIGALSIAVATGLFNEATLRRTRASAVANGLGAGAAKTIAAILLTRQMQDE